MNPLKYVKPGYQLLGAYRLLLDVVLFYQHRETKYFWPI